MIWLYMIQFVTARKTLSLLTINLTLFFFIIATIFVPVRLAEASFGKGCTASAVSLTAAYPPLKRNHFFPSPSAEKERHPINCFNKKLLQLAHAVKEVRQLSATSQNSTQRILDLHSAIIQFRNAYQELQVYWQKIKDYDADQALPQIPQAGLADELLQRQSFANLDKAVTAWQDTYKSYIAFPRYYSAQRDRYLARLAALTAAETHGLSIDGIDLHHLARREAPALNRMPLQSDKDFAPLQKELAENNSPIEGKIAADIQQFTASLHNDPQQIYQWIQKNIRFIPTYGFSKSASACLASRQGNAFDISNLLVTAFRAAGVKARFVFGSREIPEWQFRRLAGNFQKLEPALRLLRHGGIPVQYNEEKKTVKLEHLWVEAKPAVEKGWHLFDASLKTLPPDAEHSGFLLKTRSLAGELLTALLQQLEADSVLPVTQPADKKEDILYYMAGIRFSSPQQLPSLQHKVAFQFLSALQQGNPPATRIIPTMALSERLIAVDYQIEEEMGGNGAAGFGLLRPVVRLDSAIWIEGEPVPTGVIQKFRVWFFTPGTGVDYADHRIIAGQRSVLVLQSQQRGAVAGLHNPPEGEGYAALDQTLQRIGLTYLYNCGQQQERLAARNSVAAIKTAEELLVSAASPLQGEKRRKKGIWQNYSFTVDVQRSLHAAASQNNFADNERRYHWQSSRQASIAEYKALEKVLNRAALSGAYYIMAKVFSGAARDIIGEKEKYISDCLPEQIDNRKIEEEYGQKILFQDGFACLFYDNKGIANYYIDGGLGGAGDYNFDDFLDDVCDDDLFEAVNVLLKIRQIVLDPFFIMTFCLFMFTLFTFSINPLLGIFVSVICILLFFYLLVNKDFLYKPEELGLEFMFFSEGYKNYLELFARRIVTPADKLYVVKRIEEIPVKIEEYIKGCLLNYQKIWGDEAKIEFIYLTAHGFRVRKKGREEKFSCLWYDRQFVLREPENHKEKVARDLIEDMIKPEEVITPKKIGEIFRGLSDYFSKNLTIYIYSCQAGRDPDLIKQIGREIAHSLGSINVEIIAHEWGTKPLFNSPDIAGPVLIYSSKKDKSEKFLNYETDSWELKEESVAVW